ncbi:MAG: metallophosphoesterase family protein [Blautia sp.]|nr:metallophosphoesterase family protein [Blautia sp.]
MKILAISDVEEKILWDFYDKELTKDVDLIISCGDLNRHYLEFLVTMVNCPLLYVPGNHDSSYEKDPPQGCICIDDQVFDYKGLRILGLGGSMRYKPGPYMYSEREMRSRYRRLRPRISMMNGFDMLVTHAPAKGYGDLDDLPHHGFETFNEILLQHRPAYMLHGHVHSQYGRITREHQHPGGTKILNVNGHQVLELGEDAHPAHGKTGSFLYDLYVSLTAK